MAKTFAEELRAWRGDKPQKQIPDLLGIPLTTYQSWEEGKREPTEPTKAQIRWRMKPAHYRQIVIQVAEEIWKRNGHK